MHDGGSLDEKIIGDDATVATPPDASAHTIATVRVVPSSRSRASPSRNLSVSA
jgi:hypothetical protein